MNLLEQSRIYLTLEICTYLLEKHTSNIILLFINKLNANTGENTNPIVMCNCTSFSQHLHMCSHDMKCQCITRKHHTYCTANTPTYSVMNFTINLWSSNRTLFFLSTLCSGTYCYKKSLKHCILIRKEFRLKN